MFAGKASSGTWRIVVGLVFLIMLSPGAVLAQQSPRPRPGDSLPRPSPGYAYSRGEIDAAKAELALMLEDAEAVLNALRDHFIGQLGPGLSPVIVQLDEIVEESRLEIRAAWQTFDAFPDQHLPIVVYQSRDLTRKLATAKELVLRVRPSAFSPISPALPGALALTSSDVPAPGEAAFFPVLSAEATALSSSIACPDDTSFTCSADDVDETSCFLRDVGECIDVCEQLTNFLSITKESTPTDIHVVAAGFGVNVPSPFKIGAEVLHAIAKLLCNVVECTAENTDIGECTQTETLRILKAEQRFTDDYELAAQTREIKSAISQGGADLVSDIATEFEKEERFTSDQELTQMEGTLLNELSALRELTCNLERLMFVHMKKPNRPSSACAPTTSASSTSTGARGETAPPARGVPGLDPTARARSAALSRQDPAPPDPPVSLFTGELQVEKALLDERPTPALYLPAKKGGGIEQVRLMVWAAIGAQEELGIAPTETSLARDIAAKADSLLAQSDYLAAFRTYSSAYRSLVPAP